MFKNLPLSEKFSGDRSETRQFIARQGVCKALSPIVSTFLPTFQPSHAGQTGQKRTVFSGAARKAELITSFKGALDAVSLESLHMLSHCQAC